MRRPANRLDFGAARHPAPETPIRDSLLSTGRKPFQDTSDTLANFRQAISPIEDGKSYQRTVVMYSRAGSHPSRRKIVGTPMPRMSSPILGYASRVILKSVKGSSTYVSTPSLARARVSVVRSIGRARGSRDDEELRDPVSNCLCGDTECLQVCFVACAKREWVVHVGPDSGSAASLGHCSSEVFVSVVQQTLSVARKIDKISRTRVVGRAVEGDIKHSGVRVESLGRPCERRSGGRQRRVLSRVLK